MYISEIELKNVRCCKHLLLPFQGKPGSTLIIGDNGDGKTTVLRSIGMGLCDESSAAALLRDLHGDLVREEADEALIRVTLKASKGVHYRIDTKIRELKAFERVSQEVFRRRGSQWKRLREDQFPWEEIFVSGYGAGTRTQGTADYQYYIPVDAVYPLFKYDMPLQNPELALRRIVEEASARGRSAETKHRRRGTMQEYLLQLLKSLLMLEAKDTVLLTATGLEVKSHRWGQIELSALGDGYKATTTWILDLLSWWMLYLQLENKSLYSNRDIAGVVIIDEMEQHLHPRWQLRICELLKGLFPKVQFIVATHSPLVVSGCENTPIYALHRGRHTTKSAYGWLPEDVLREIMGLGRVRPAAVSNRIEMYEKLHLKSLQRDISKTEKAQLRRMRRVIHSYRGADQDVLMRELGNLVKQLKAVSKREKK